LIARAGDQPENHQQHRVAPFPRGGPPDKVDHWKNSNQRQRWAATALLDIEPDLRRIKGFRHLTALRHALQVELNLVPNQNQKLA